MSKLIILRGPSGAGKSTVAKDLFKRTKQSAVLIEQDYYRFIFKPAGGAVNSKAIHDMIKANVLIALQDKYDVILESTYYIVRALPPDEPPLILQSGIVETFRGETDMYAPSTSDIDGRPPSAGEVASFVIPVANEMKNHSFALVTA